jgi:hypothetical protein
MSGTEETKLVIVTFLWKNENDLRPMSSYQIEHVNILARSLARNLDRPYRFVCITDFHEDPRFECETFPMWDDFRAKSHPFSPTYVNCYPRLKIFSEEVGRALDADVILSLDVDLVITGPLDSVLDKFEPPFMGYRVKWNSRPLTYNGSMFMFEVGHPEVTQLWDQFDIAKSPELARLFGYRGSDQAWISFRLSNRYPFWEPADGVRSYRKELRQRDDLPEPTYMVHYFGRHNPWDEESQHYSWIKEHYR